GWNTRTICYEQGRITYIAAATRLPSVVDLLIQAGKLKPRQLERTFGPNWKQTCHLGQADLPVPDTDSMLEERINGSLNGTNGHHNGKWNGHRATLSCLTTSAITRAMS